MSVFYSFLIICLFGSLEARHPDIDINRLKLIPKEVSRFHHTNTHGRRSVNEVLQSRHDFDDRGSRLLDPRPSVHLLRDPTTRKEYKPLKIHQPREDPRLFYQSDVYLKEIASKDLNNEVSHIYPGRDVIRAQERSRLTVDPDLDESLKYNIIDSDNPCVRCPHDRTLIVKPGSDRVVLQYPRLQSCSRGQTLARNVRFVHMYGPDFGSLLQQGSHVVVGKIVHNYKTLQVCKLQITVMVQPQCAVPKTLVAHCDSKNNTCSFSCRDSRQILRGHATLSCMEGTKKWSGHLPICKARTWCEPLLPPDHGTISCKGATTGDGSGLLEGSSCRVRCKRGYKWTPRSSAVCRRGTWTHTLSCLSKRM